MAAASCSFTPAERDDKGHAFMTLMVEGMTRPCVWTAGLGIGVLLACCSFVVQGSLVNPIAAAFLGDGLRSREMRTNEERKVLDIRMQGVVYVVR